MSVTRLVDTSLVTASDVLAGLGISGSAWAAPLAGGEGAGFGEDAPVTPASVMKVQVALAVESLIAAGKVDGTEPRVLRAGRRTPGPTGISLMRDDVTVSVRDLVIAMLTVSDNAATDELIALLGVERINQLTADLGMKETAITSDLRQLLEDVAHAAGFADYSSLVAHDPALDGPPSAQQIRDRMAQARALDPALGTRTTAHEMVALLQAIWADQAAAPEACQRVRDGMARQLTRNRIASGFDDSVKVAAKSGALLGIVRNEVGVVTVPDGRAYAVAVFTRKDPDNTADPAQIDRGIGQIARTLVGHLQTHRSERPASGKRHAG
jgi:beta-lactamase class A